MEKRGDKQAAINVLRPGLVNCPKTPGEISLPGSCQAVRSFESFPKSVTCLNSKMYSAVLHFEHALRSNFIGILILDSFAFLESLLL